jgi:hypothetical protein
MDRDFVLSYGKGGLDGLAEHELTSPPVGRKWQLDRQKQLGNAKIPDLAITNVDTGLLVPRGTRDSGVEQDVVSWWSDRKPGYTNADRTILQ